MHIKHELPTLCSEHAIMVLSSDTGGLLAQIKPFLRMRQVKQLRMASRGWVRRGGA